MPALRLLIAIAVLAMLVRAGRAAWANRGLSVRVWRGIRVRHVAGSAALLVVVLAVAVGVATLVPVTQYGLGSLVGLTGNAVFAPVEEAALRTGEQPLAEGGGALSPWFTIGLCAFLVALVAMFPWLAYSEERTFRTGLERASTARQAVAALRFGLLHLLMLIPVAAALAVGVAGFWYGRVYRSAFARARRDSKVVVGPLGLVSEEGPTVAEARHAAVLASTVWHTTFNTLIVALVIAGLLVTG